MVLKEFEECLKVQERRIQTYCNFHAKKLIELQRQLIHLYTAINLTERFELNEIRVRLKNLFVNYFSIRNIHYVSFYDGCEYRSFWEEHDGPALFCRRTTGTIDYLDNAVTTTKLCAKNNLIVKCIGKFSFIYIEFFQEQTLVKLENFQESIELLQFIFHVYEEQNKEDIAENLMRMVEWLSKKSRKVIEEVFHSQCNSTISNNTVLVPNNPLLSLLLSKIYSNALLDLAFYNSVIFRGKTLKKQGQRYIFKDGKVLFTFNSHAMNLNSLQEIEKLTVQGLLTQLNLSSRTISNILEKVEQDGNHFSSCRAWNLSVNLSINAVQISISNRRVSRKVNVDEYRIMKEILGQGRKNLQETIGNQFIPQAQEVRFKGQKASTKKITTFKMDKMDPINTIKIEFKETVDLNTLRQMQFNVLDHNVNSVGNFINSIFLDRFKQMKFSEQKLQNFISKVAYSYQRRSNPFHNFHHGFTVFHGAYILSLNKFVQSTFSPNTLLAFVVSALCHDLDHTGFTNTFEEKTQTKLANRFGDRSILENNSIAQAFKILSFQSTNFLCDLDTSDQRHFRKILVSSILATDNKHHTIVISEFDAIITEQKKGDFSQNSIQTLIGALLHCCDFWGNVKPYPVSKQWSERINRQFSNQYQKQMQAGIQPTPYFKDLNNIQVVAKNQNVFISAVVYPLYKKIDDWIDGFLQPCLEAIDKNLRIWKKIEQGHQITSLQEFIV